MNLVGWLLLAFLAFLVTYLGIKGFKLAEEDSRRLRDKSCYSRKIVKAKGEDFKERIVEAFRKER